MREYAAAGGCKTIAKTSRLGITNESGGRRFAFPPYECSQITIGKITVIPTTKLGPNIGRADDTLMVRVNRALALFLGVV